MARILIVDDEGKMRALLAMALDQEGYEIAEAESGEDALKKLAIFRPQVMLTDVRMPGMTGLDLLKRVKEESSDTEVIVMTAYADAKTGIEAMRAGALEYVAKPFEMDEVVLLVKNALEKNSLQEQVRALRIGSQERWALDNLIGTSKAIQETVQQAKVVAPRNTTVLVLGKSGTGKELIARGIHAESGRKNFVAVNCGAILDSLLESELFGHEKGAFTGAHAQRAGIFETAGEGTVFLDEIGDISAGLQVKLLRVLQEREFTRVGGTGVIKTGARVIAATNRNLAKAVENGEFREDLYYRLSIFPVAVPSLCERVEDIPALVDAFCLKFKHTRGIEDGVLKKLMEYSWPGNVRELENCIERCAIVAGAGPIAASHLPEHIRENHTLSAPTFFELPPEGISLDEVEKNLITQALSRAEGNKTRAAQLLGISRRAIYSKMKTHSIPGYDSE